LPRRAALAVGWALTAAMALVALLRIVAWDDAEPLVVFDALSLYLYLPAWVIAYVAGVRRHLALATLALAVAVAQVAFVLPELTAGRVLPAWTTGAPSLTLLDANVSDANRSMSGYIAQIRADHPGLVTLEEATPFDAVQLEKTGALAALPYRYEVDRFDPWAFVVASRWPLRSTSVVSMFGRPLVVRTTLELRSGPVQLWVVHTTAPLPGAWRQWSAQLAEVAGMLEARRSERLLVVGDFNADWGSRLFRAILATGLTDGAAARGQALGMTWSQLVAPLPPFVRIDHVLVAAGLSVLAVRTGAGVGSDHRDLLATIAVHEPEARRPAAPR
jgi:endonuclease/exonuclease/phosphatase (EEP) superfamily protein YafD